MFVRSIPIPLPGQNGEVALPFRPGTGGKLRSSAKTGVDAFRSVFSKPEGTNDVANGGSSMATSAAASAALVLDGEIGRQHIAEMTALPEPRAATTEAFLARSGEELAALCTACGACFDACPMVDHIGLHDADPQLATNGLRALARGETAPGETVSWVGACTRSGLCVAACPQLAAGLDAMLLIRIAKQNAINRTQQLQPKYDQGLFPRVKTFARLQLSDDELDAWL